MREAQGGALESLPQGFRGGLLIFSAGHTYAYTHIYPPIHSWTMPSSTLVLEPTRPSVQLGSRGRESWSHVPQGQCLPGVELIRPTPMAVPEKSCQPALKAPVDPGEFREGGNTEGWRGGCRNLQRARRMLALGSLHGWLCDFGRVISPLCASASSSINEDL